ncbi:MAG: SRPBCC family protein [Blastocatellia bacterium]|nr:SRPBCC family protein [Blastocatellia bacterium]
MISVSKKATINAAAADVWKTISDFNGLPRFVLLIVDSKVEGEGVGAVRTITLQDGQQGVETLSFLDDENMTLRYSLADDPGRPFKGYVATMKLTALGDNECELEWSSAFEAQGGASEEEAKALPAGLYEIGIAGLKKLHEN